jgi:hypothetical protein
MEHGRAPATIDGCKFLCPYCATLVEGVSITPRTMTIVVTRCHRSHARVPSHDWKLVESTGADVRSWAPGDLVPTR